MDRNEFLKASLDDAMTMLKDSPDVNALSSSGQTLMQDVIHWFEKKNTVKKVELLLKMSADPNKKAGYSEDSAIIDAVRSDIGSELIQLLLDYGANINLQNKDGNTAIHKALSYYFYSQPQKSSSNALYLIDAGADVDLQNTDGRTPLMEAVNVVTSDLELIRLLITKSANINLTDKDGRTAFSLAAVRGNAEVLAQLLTAGADMRPDNSGHTPLHYAVAFPEVLGQLLNAGASIDHQDNEGMTALHLAIKCAWEYGASQRVQTNSVETLLAKGASVDVKNYKGRTPLMLACSLGINGMVKLLINAGADINDLDGEGITPLMCASIDLECSKSLVKAGADINARDNESRSPLLWAIKNRSSAVTNLLLKKNSDITVRDMEEKSAIHYAISGYGSTEILTHLIDAGAVIDEVNQQGATPLMLSGLNQTELLLKYGPNLSLQDLNGNTVLHYVAKGNDPVKQLKILFQAGAPLDIQNSDGKTALMLCARDSKSVKLLIDAGANPNLTDAEGKSATCFADPESLRFLIQSGAVPNALESINLQHALQHDDLPLAILLFERGIKAQVEFDFYTQIKKTLTKIAQSKAGLLQQGIECKDSDTQEELSKLLDKYKGQADQASEDECPSMLRQGGWPKINMGRKKIVIPSERFAGLVASTPRFFLDDKIQKRSLDLHQIRKQREIDDDEKLQTAIEKFLKKKAMVEVKFSLLVKASDALLLSVWNEHAAMLINNFDMGGSSWPPKKFGPEDLRYLIARLHLAGLPGALSAVNSYPRLLSALLAVDSPECATIMSMQMVGAEASIARKWMTDFSTSAITGLLPVALGKLCKERDASEAALRYLSLSGHKLEMEKLAAEIGNDVVDALEEVLEQDASSDFIPKKLPTIPSFWSAETYPSPKLKLNGKSLPHEAINNLAKIMSASSMEFKPLAIDEIKELCDSKSLADFAWAAFEDWASKGNKDNDWIFCALSYFGDDICARKLTPYIREWPKSNGTAKAKMGLEILAAIGSDVALTQIQAVAQKNKYETVLDHARLMIERIAKERNLTATELEDILVPTLGLSDDGTIEIDYGSRKFLGSVDTELKVVLQDGAGAIIKTLPAIGKNDDKSIAEEHAANWTVFCKELKPVAKQQLERFELAMINGRRWPGNTFINLMIPHPLLREFVRGIVWGLFNKRKLVQSFCVDESGKTVDVNGAQVKLADNASIGVAYPLELGSDVESWKKNFSARKQAQPFAQMTRRVYRREEDVNQDCFGLNGAVVPSKALKGLKAMGWGQEIGDAGWIWGFDKKGCSIGAEPGVHINDYEWGGATEQKLEVTISSKLDEIEYSEIVRELQTLRK